MPPYASVDDFRLAFEGYGDRMRRLLGTDQDTQDRRATQILTAASGLIDRALGLAGHAAPADTAGAPAGLRDGITAQLREICIGLAIGGLAPAASDLPDNLLAAFERAEAAIGFKSGAPVMAFALDGNYRPRSTLFIPGLP